MERNEAIKRIRAALKKRSGKSWSVTGGRGTGWGWIRIESPPARRTAHYERLYPGADAVLMDTGVPGGYMTPEDCKLLAELLGKETIHYQGDNIPASTEYRQEYVDRAEGRVPSVYGVRYWD